MRKVSNERILKALETIQTACAQRDCRGCILNGRYECLFSVKRFADDGLFYDENPENWDLRDIRKLVYQK